MAALLDSDPRTVSGYTLHSRLGEGAYGVVYAATHARFGSVALKVLRPTLADIPQVRARLRAEAQMLQRVQGNCTAAVLEVNADAPVPYLALELVEGLNLVQYVGAHGPFKGPILEALKDGLVEALASVHAANLVHRDLKPTNIMYGPAGVKVLDFGISVLLEVAANTGTNITLGTETWMSPEQAQGDPVGPASDVFNLGMVLAYAATGVHPFGAGKPAALVYRVVHERPNLAGVPSSVMAFVAQCLQKDALQRPDLRMHAVADRVEPPTVVDLGTGVPPLPPPPPPPGGSWIFRVGYGLDRIWRSWRTIFLLVLLITVGVGMISFAVVTIAIKDGKFNGHGTVMYANGDTYTGEFKDGKRYSQGTYTYTYANGDTFTGEFKDDKFTDDSIYTSEYKNYMRNGQGTLKLADGSTYVGAWKDGESNGQGTFTGADGGNYAGEFKDDKYNGQGTITYADGDTYTGAFKDGNPDGQGTITYADGGKYAGEVKDGKPNGQGTMTTAEGTYIGEFKDGNWNGHGTLKLADGDTYNGEFKDGLSNGQGTRTFTNGSTYTGEWKDNVPNGLGTMTFTDGSMYIGEYKDGEFNGHGTYTVADGRTYTGEWKDGLPVP